MDVSTLEMTSITSLPSHQNRIRHATCGNRYYWTDQFIMATIRVHIKTSEACGNGIDIRIWNSEIINVRVSTSYVFNVLRNPNMLYTPWKKYPIPFIYNLLCEWWKWFAPNIRLLTNAKECRCNIIKSQNDPNNRYGSPQINKRWIQYINEP